ncbi:unnamed protein product, partial [marine sediment metagenome]
KASKIPNYPYTCTRAYAPARPRVAANLAAGGLVHANA